MSNALAVAATTATLVNLLVQATPNVTALPPDKAHDEGAEDQLNVFLYSLGLAAAWRNADPIGTPPGETGPSPLPLVLHYLVTAYAGTEVKAHALLGAAMSVLHDHAVLGSDEIHDATSVEMPTSDLHLQSERVRVTPLQIPLHDMSELWSGFSTALRVSQAYEVGVVLIDSTRPRIAPLPVLRQGPGENHPLAVPGPAAVLDAVLPAAGSVAVLGGTLRVLGSGFERVTGVRIRNRRVLDRPPLVPAAERSGTELAVDLPDASAAMDTWVAGVHDVALTSQLPGLPLLMSNVRSFAIGPTITVAPTHAAAGDLALTLTCSPRIKDGQEVAVLLGAGSPQPATVVTPADTTQPSVVTVTFPAVGTGTYVVRLRLDGVDSDPVRYVGSPSMPEFDPASQVVVA